MGNPRPDKNFVGISLASISSMAISARSASSADGMLGDLVPTHPLTNAARTRYEQAFFIVPIPL